MEATSRPKIVLERFNFHSLVHTAVKDVQERAEKVSEDDLNGSVSENLGTQRRTEDGLFEDDWSLMDDTEDSDLVPVATVSRKGANKRQRGDAFRKLDPKSSSFARPQSFLFISI